MNTESEKQPTGENDREALLLRKVAGEDKAALAELYGVYQPRLFKFVFRLTGSYTAADELANDIMLIVWRKASTFRGDSKVSTWIFGIAYRQAMRRLSRKKLRIADFRDLESVAADNDTNIEREDWIQRSLSGLPAAQQTSMMLVFYLGLSYEEVATVTGCPVNTVKTRMFHARKKLKELLSATAKHGPGSSED